MSKVRNTSSFTWWEPLTSDSNFHEVSNHARKKKRCFVVSLCVFVKLWTDFFMCGSARACLCSSVQKVCFNVHRIACGVWMNLTWVWPKLGHVHRSRSILRRRNHPTFVTVHLVYAPFKEVAQKWRVECNICFAVPRLYRRGATDAIFPGVAARAASVSAFLCRCNRPVLQSSSFHWTGSSLSPPLCWYSLLYMCHILSW